MNSLNGHRLLCVLATSLALAVGVLSGPRASEEELEGEALEVMSVGAIDLASAQATTDVLTNALVAAVASISGATPPGSTAQEIADASAAVSALLPKKRRPYALVDASGMPLDPMNHTRGSFETNGMAALVAGAPVVQQVIGNKLRTLVPLTNDMHPNCVTCHANYAGLAPGTVVGAASLRIKL